MKTYLKILIVLAIWAAVTWRFRESLLPLPKRESGPVPHIRHPEAPAQARPAPHSSKAPTDTPADDLTEIKGIGPVYQERLAEIGITTFASLAEAAPGHTAERLDIAPAMVEDWKIQAASRSS